MASPKRARDPVTDYTGVGLALGLALGAAVGKSIKKKQAAEVPKA